MTERGDDRMIDRHRFDVQTSRSHDERTIIRGGQGAIVRVLGADVHGRRAPGLDARRRLQRGGAYGEDGEPLTLEHRRMTVVGRK